MFLAYVAIVDLLRCSGSITLQVEDPGRQAPGSNDHATSVRKVCLGIVLDLQVSNLTWVEWARKLGRQRKVWIVEVYGEIALLIERVLEVNAYRFGSWDTADWTLRLWRRGFAEKQARVLHTFRASKFQHGSAVTDSKWFVTYVDLQIDAPLIDCSGSWGCGDISLKVTSTWTVYSFNLNCIGCCLPQEM